MRLAIVEGVNVAVDVGYFAIKLPNAEHEQNGKPTHSPTFPIISYEVEQFRSARTDNGTTSLDYATLPLGTTALLGTFVSEAQFWVVVQFETEKKLENFRARGRAAPHGLQFLPYSPNVALTPAMEAGVSDHVWSLGEVITLLG